MGTHGDSAEALIEILSLCEQTLTALTPQAESTALPPPSDTIRRQKFPRRANVNRRLWLIKGGSYRSHGESETS
jgi:hypothetical protein